MDTDFEELVRSNFVQASSVNSHHLSNPSNLWLNSAPHLKLRNPDQDSSQFLQWFSVLQWLKNVASSSKHHPPPTHQLESFCVVFANSAWLFRSLWGSAYFIMRTLIKPTVENPQLC
jgi:hypothetical protein